MPTISPGKQTSSLDRNAWSPDRLRRNMQRLRNGAATSTLKLDGSTLSLNDAGELTASTGLEVNETPGGTIDGTNTAFTLSMAPIDGKLILMVDGLTMLEGADYTLAGNTITFLTGAIPQTGDWIRATYQG